MTSISYRSAGFSSYSFRIALINRKHDASFGKIQATFVHRLIVVRRVDELVDALAYLHQGVSTVGIYPESRRVEMRVLVTAIGVSNIMPLGQCERVFPGAPHDGMDVLSELVV